MFLRQQYHLQGEKSTTTFIGGKLMYKRKIYNLDIREYAKNKGVPLYVIASKLGINDGNFSRKLRTELPEEKKTEIKAIIDNLAAGR